ALPFTVIMLMFILSLVKALSIDSEYFESKFSVYTVPWSGKLWKERLENILSFSGRKTVDGFIKITVKPAFEELQKEFAKNGIKAEVISSTDPQRSEIKIQYDNFNSFVYGVKMDYQKISGYIDEENNMPNPNEGRSYIAKAYFGDNREGYDVQLFTSN